MMGSSLGKFMAINIIFIMAIAWIIIFGNTYTFELTWNERECLQKEWQDCTPEDKIGDCEIYIEYITTGPYYNETTEPAIKMRKEVCVRYED